MRGLLADWRYTVGLVSGGHFLSHFYLLTFPPLFPLLRTEFGLSNVELGLILAVVQLSITALQIPVGELVDRIGGRWVFLVGMGLTALGITFAGLAGSYPVLLAAALLSGVGQSVFHPADYALLDAVTTDNVEGKAFSVHMFGGHAGFAAAPLVVGGLGLAAGWEVALVAVGVVGLAFTVFAVLTLRADSMDAAGRAAAGQAASPSIRESARALFNPPVLVLFGLYFTLSAALFGFQSFSTVFFEDALGLTVGAGNNALTVFFVFVAGGTLVGGALSDRIAPRRLIVTTVALSTVGAGLLVSGIPVGRELVAAALYAVTGLGLGMSIPSRDRLTNALSAAGSTGKSFAFVFTGISISGLVVPPFLGAVIDYATVTLAFTFVAVFFLLGILLALSLGSGAISVDATRAEAGGN